MENQRGLSIAVMLSLVGLLGLCLGTTMGFLLEGKQMGEAIAIGAGVFVVGGVALYLAVKAKTVDSEFAKWRKFEYLGLAACVVVIGFAEQPTIYSANFLFDNQRLRDAGVNDIATINGMISSFKDQEGRRLSLTRQGLENYLNFMPSKISNAAGSYIANEVVHGRIEDFNRYVLNDFIAEKSYIIENGSLHEDLFGRYQSQLADISDKLSGFVFTDFAGLATSLTVVSDSVGANLSALSRNLNLYNISIDENGECISTPTDSYNYTARATEFGNEYASMFKPKIGSALLFVAFALLFLIDYILEFRSLKVPGNAGPKISDNDGLPL